MDEKIDCRVYEEANGKRLVFVVKGTTRCVGEIFIAADDRYLQVISQLFSHWVRTVRPTLPASIRNIINGTAKRVG